VEVQLHIVRPQRLRRQVSLIGGGQPAWLRRQLAAPFGVGLLPQRFKLAGDLGQPVPVGQVSIPAWAVENHRLHSLGVTGDVLQGIAAAVGVSEYRPGRNLQMFPERLKIGNQQLRG
jgi:hypothetical protein